MFDIIECDYNELTEINQKYCFEVDLFCYKDIEMIYKIYESNSLIGVILFEEKGSNLGIEYFDIFNGYRNKGIGTEFITWLLENSNRSFCLTPLNQRAEKFWEGCGFKHCKGNYNIMFNEPII